MITIEALEKMNAMGLTLEQAIELLRSMSKTNGAAERQREYRKRKRERDVTGDVTRDVTGDVTPPVPLAPSPQTPQPHTPTPPDITTRAKADLAKPFAEFWANYPRKVGKPLAAKAYAKACERLHRSGYDPPAEILGGLMRQLDGFSQREPDLVPHPTTWLNRDGWEDQPDTPRQPRQTNGAHVQHRPDPRQIAREDNHARAFAGSEAAARRRAPVPG